MHCPTVDPKLARLVSKRVNTFRRVSDTATGQVHEFHTFS